MSVSSVSSVSFKGQDAPVQRQKGGGGKAAASFFIPGLGEFLDGRNKEGAGFLAARVGNYLLLSVLSSKFIKNSFDSCISLNGLKSGNKLLEAAVALLSFTSFGLAIANTVDAYKGGTDKKIDTEA